MFLASKLEDVYQIPLKDFVKRVSHGKYSMYCDKNIPPRLDIKVIESDILETFQFNVYFPSHLNFLTLFYFKCFNLNDKY